MKVFIVPDTHMPFTDKDALKEVYKAIAIEKPDAVIQVGDLLDQYVFSRYTRDLNLITPSDEVEEGFYMAREFWNKVNKIARNADKYQLIGNHDIRVNKRIKEKLPELEVLLNVTKRLYTFDRVKVYKSDRDYMILDNTVYTHGWLTKLGDHMKYFGMSVVHGHSHKPGLVFARTLLDHTFELDVGHLADENSVPLSYTQSKYSKWLKAFGVVTNNKPRLEIL